jgi:phenylpyruvate tautomerase PptA (4-oxalocrotonate tautomerase family)
MASLVDMPIISVEVVDDGDDLPHDLAQRLADGIGDFLDSPPHQTWVRVHLIDPLDYAENGGCVSGVRPVIVTLIIGRRPEPKRLSSVAVALTEVVAAATGRPAGNVHLIFEADGIGRVAFGGALAG